MRLLLAIIYHLSFKFDIVDFAGVFS